MQNRTINSVMVLSAASGAGHISLTTPSKCITIGISNATQKGKVN